MFKFFGSKDEWDRDHLYIENTISGEKRFCYKATKYCVHTFSYTGVELSLEEVVEFFQDPPFKEYRWDA